MVDFHVIEEFVGYTNACIQVGKAGRDSLWGLRITYGGHTDEVHGTLLEVWRGAEKICRKHLKNLKNSSMGG